MNRDTFEGLCIGGPLGGQVYAAQHPKMLVMMPRMPNDWNDERSAQRIARTDYQWKPLCAVGPNWKLEAFCWVWRGCKAPESVLLAHILAHAMLPAPRPTP